MGIIKISEEDCHKVIRAKFKNDFKILSFEEVPFAEINGYLGEHCTLRITLEDETHSFFVKSLPKVESQRTFLEEINGVFKEKSFFGKYRSLLKNHGVDVLDRVVPTCYYVTEELFVFEDLKARGYECFSCRTPLGIDYVKAALRSLAKLHASGLILEELKSRPLTFDFQVELKESFYLGTDSTERGLYAGKQGLKALIDVTHEDRMKISKDSFKVKALEGVDLQKMFTTPSTRFRNTICHADTWTKNFLFKVEENGDINCVVVDFQTYRYGPPAQDVLTFIHMVTDRALRERHFDELLRFYYEELKSNLEKYGFRDVVTRDEFFESCLYFKQFGLTQTLLHFQVVIMSDETAREIFQDPEKARKVLFDDKYDFFQMLFRSDRSFKERNLEAIADLREFYENKLII